MDALPLEEATGHPFASKIPGRMHACGHDGHMAIGLAVAERLARSAPGRGLRFLYQPAEEGGGGAEACVNDGALEGVGAALGLHLWSGLPLGTIGLNRGALMAAVDEFTIEIESPGGHGAMPHETVDPILAAARMVESLQSVVSREISPLDSAVVTIGRIEGGTAFNIIPRSVTLQGTGRSFTPETGRALPEKIARIVHGTAAACGVEARVRYERLNGATVNDPRVADIVIESAARVVGEENVATDTRTLAGEDMCVYLDRVPGCFFFVGCAPEGEPRPHHSRRFDLDERALGIGVAVLEAAARDVARQI
jgi:amidohydrolase